VAQSSRRRQSGNDVLRVVEELSGERGTQSIDGRAPRHLLEGARKLLSRAVEGDVARAGQDPGEGRDLALAVRPDHCDQLAQGPLERGRPSGRGQGRVRSVMPRRSRGSRALTSDLLSFRSLRTVDERAAQRSQLGAATRGWCRGDQPSLSQGGVGNPGSLERHWRVVALERTPAVFGVQQRGWRWFAGQRRRTTFSK
jgi:hypothetical protein